MKMSLFRTLIFAIGLSAVMLTTVMIHPAQSESAKMGYVDSQIVLDKSLKGKEVKETLNDYVQSRQKIVDIEEADLKKLQDEMSKQGAILSPEARREKEEGFQKKFMEYQKKVNELQKEIQQRRTEILEKFNEELEKIVKVIGEKDGYDMILNNLEVNIVMYAKPSINLTDRVIIELDKEMKKDEKSKK